MTAAARKPYATDLTDAQWSLLEPLLLASENRIRPGPAREVNLRDVALSEPDGLPMALVTP